MKAICHFRPFYLRSQLYLDGVVEAACYDIGQTLLFQTVEYITTEDAYSGDTRSPIPVISVHSVGNLQYRRQS